MFWWTDPVVVTLIDGPLAVHFDGMFSEVDTFVHHPKKAPRTWQELGVIAIVWYYVRTWTSWWKVVSKFCSTTLALCLIFFRFGRNKDVENLETFCPTSRLNIWIWELPMKGALYISIHSILIHHHYFGSWSVDPLFISSFNGVSIGEAL